MKPKFTVHLAIMLATLALLLVQPAAHHSTRAISVLNPPEVGINGVFATNKAQRGRSTLAAIVMDVPDGYYVTTNRSQGKFPKPPLKVNVTAPQGVKVSPIIFPRGVSHQFSFPGESPESLFVYEGRTVLRFNVIVPANYSQSSAEIRVRVQYQSCNSKECFLPVTRNITMPIEVVNANERVERANSQYFKGRG